MFEYKDASFYTSYFKNLEDFKIIEEFKLSEEEKKAILNRVDNVKEAVEKGLIDSIALTLSRAPIRPTK